MATLPDVLTTPEQDRVIFLNVTSPTSVINVTFRVVGAQEEQKQSRTQMLGIDRERAVHLRERRVFVASVERDLGQRELGRDEFGIRFRGRLQMRERFAAAGALFITTDEIEQPRVALDVGERFGERTVARRDFAREAGQDRGRERDDWTVDAGRARTRKRAPQRGEIAFSVFEHALHLQ